MRCVFCKQDSSGSRSIEHIIPQSLGNALHTLPVGVVCDHCNNYFSKEVEKPFLETPWARTLRFHQALVSKKGRIPSIAGLLQRSVPVSAIRSSKDGSTHLEVPSGAFNFIASLSQGELILPLEGPWPSGPIASRFAAKVAIEAMAARVMHLEGGVDWLSNEDQFDLLRDHARRGRQMDWPTHIRRIYAADHPVLGPRGEAEQILHEFDFLVTQSSEWYFILAIFGLEFTINLGGPQIGGYIAWLRENNDISPLYAAKTPSAQ